MILDAIVCIILIASILGQEAKSAGMGGMGGGADTVFSSKARHGRVARSRDGRLRHPVCGHHHRDCTYDELIG